METVDTKQLDSDIEYIQGRISQLEFELSNAKKHLENLEHQKKSIELYNKKS